MAKITTNGKKPDQKFGNAFIRLFILEDGNLWHEKAAPFVDERPCLLPVPQNLSGLQNSHSGLESISLFSLPPKIGVHPFLENEKTPHRFHFLGRLAVQRLDSLFHYRKNTPIQTILHRIKYHHYPELAEELGRYYGKYLNASGNYSHITAIVPIPLHPSKQEKRGYNQAEEFAKGLAESMDLTLSSKILKKSTQTTTQTKKNRNERAQELSDSFEIFWSKKRKNPHFLLVDDVITTGATLEAAGRKLLEIPGARLSMVSLAVVI